MDKEKWWFIDRETFLVELFAVVAIVGGVVFIGHKAQIWTVPMWVWVTLFVTGGILSILALFSDA
ncbi:MAG: hypothetical protein AAB642_02025 [Patescibacteria group bacterium]